MDKTLRILIVDDNADAADSLATLLQLDGHSVHVAYDAYDALSCGRDHGFDVALLDIALPKLNGYELGTRLRSMQPEIRLVALTGFGRPVDRARSEASGFQYHFVKPANLAELSNALGAIAGGLS